MLLCAALGQAWAAETVAYTFTTPKGESDYTKFKDITIDNIVWNVPGNQVSDGALRLGGKSLDGVDRVITGKGSLADAITKITVNHSGTTSDKLIVNSVMVTVASDANFSNVIETITLTPTIEKNVSGSFVFTPSSGSWSNNSFYKFTFNLSNSAGTNYAFVLNSIVFYKNDGNTDPVDPSITLATTDIKVGETTTISFPSNLSEVIFDSNDEGVATVDEDGVITGVGAGTTTITVMWEGDDNYNEGDTEFTVNVSKYDAAVTLSTTTLKVGKTATISYPEDLTIIFESDDEGVATVSEDGVITAVGAGTATISAVWGDNKYEDGETEFNIIVTESSSSGIVFEPVTSTSQLVAGNEYIIVAEAPTDKGDGFYTFGTKCEGNSTAAQAIKVDEEDGEITINDDVVTLTLGGETNAWTFTTSDDMGDICITTDGNRLDYTSLKTLDDEKMKLWTITNDFQVINNMYNNRYIQYNYNSGSPRFAGYKNTQTEAVLYVKKGSQTNTKTDPNLSFGATTSFTAFVGGDFTAPALINPYNLEGITYESSNDDIASVDSETGAVTIGSTEGVATITASFAGNDNYNAGNASYTITVSKATQGLTVNNAPTSMLLGESIQLDWTSSSGNSVTITTSDATVIELDDEEEGLLHAVGAGTATITVSQEETEAYKADEVSFTVTVTDPSSSQTFVKVTNLNQVVAGNKYILVTENGKAMGAQDGNFRDEVEVTLDGNIAYVNDDVAVLTLGGKAGAWTFSPSDMAGELSYISEDNNQLVTKTNATDAEKLWRISNDFQVWHRAFSGRNIQDNKDANHFGCFRNTQVPSYLYVEQGSAINENYKKDPVLSIANVFLELGSGSKKPKVSTPSNGTITYSGFESSIVTFTDGNMEAVAEGTTTVTATLEATTEYEGDVTTFTITVVPAHSNMASHLYKKVTSNDDLTAGKYLIVYEEGSKAFNGGLTTLDAAGNVIDVTINNNKIFCDEDAYFLIDPDPEAGTIRSASGYYIGITGSSNGLKTSKDSDTYTNEISIDDNEDAVIQIGTMKLRFNKGQNDNRFRYYKSSQQAIQLYKAVDPFIFSIKEEAYDGADHYATISALGSEEYYQVSGGAEVFTLTVNNHKLVFSAPFTDGDVIPSNEAYLVRGVPGDYEFTAAATPDKDVTPSENLLASSGESGVTAEEMAEAHDHGYVFYKLTLHPRTGKAGFLWGAADGAAFDYTAGHQAYLAVPPTALTTQAVSGYYFDGTTTGIDEITIPQGVNDGSVYTLSGVRVNGKDLPKGIYVVNGKKMVIK